MDINQQKEQFSYAYIYAIASTAGYSFQIAAPPTENQTTITVSIPRQNIFNVEALKNLMQQIGAGKAL